MCVHKLQRVSKPARLTVCFDDGVRVAAWGASRATEPGGRYGRRNELLYYLAKWLQSRSQFPSFSFLFSVSADVLHETHVVQMVIYEVHRGREVGGA